MTPLGFDHSGSVPSIAAWATEGPNLEIRKCLSPTRYTTASGVNFAPRIGSLGVRSHFSSTAA